MSAPGTTPGPWVAGYGADGYFFLTHDDGLELPQTRENLDMLGAGPDLYAALVDARERITQLRDPEANGPWNDRLQRMIDAALAKASPPAPSSEREK